MTFDPANLEEAYRHINVTDPSIADGDPVVTFYEYVDEGRRNNYISDRTQWATNALEIIANGRQSQLLSFILTIIPHLTRQNVALLATRPASAPKQLTTNGILENQKNLTSSIAVPPPSITTQSSAAPPAPVISKAPPSSAQPTGPLVSSSQNDLNKALPNNTFTASWNSSSASEYEPSDDSDSDGSDSADSNIPEEFGGKFWDGKTFRCDDCCSALEAGQCPNGHEIDPCLSCHRDFEPLTCLAFCDNCHAARGGPCGDCVVIDGEDTEDEEGIGKYRMIWDDEDGIWRCTTCMWEIEADGDNEGHCQCAPDSNDTNLPTLQLAPDLPSIEVARPIELQYYHDYEPADSASSGESADTETDSGDESFIDDDDEGHLEPALHTSKSNQLPPPSGSVTASEREGPLATPETVLSHTT